MLADFQEFLVIFELFSNSTTVHAVVTVFWDDEKQNRLVLGKLFRRVENVHPVVVLAPASWFASSCPTEVNIL